MRPSKNEKFFTSDLITSKLWIPIGYFFIDYYFYPYFITLRIIGISSIPLLNKFCLFFVNPLTLR